MQSLEIEKPTTLSGIEKYLSSGMIRGVGPATAKLLIRAFGEKTLDVLYSEPDKLLDVPGIGEKRARMIQESYAEQAQQREAMVFCRVTASPLPLPSKSISGMAKTCGRSSPAIPTGLWRT
ncbi:MAG: helix-hairpin-helix domain-containing protein [Christensenellales bacterium]